MLARGRSRFDEAIIMNMGIKKIELTLQKAEGQ